MNTLCQIILASTLVGLVSILICAILLGFRINVRRLTFYLISIASGTLLGAAFLHLIPEALHYNPEKALFRIALGVFVFFILEKFLIWRHCHQHQRPEDHTKPVAANMILAGDAIHNFIDGIIIASSFMAGTSVGISITIAIILHEVPQELGDFGILIHGGYTVKQALIANALTATTALAGAILTYFFFSVSSSIQPVILPIAAGGLLYVALADLIPQLHEQTFLKHTLLQILLIASGFGVIMALR